MHYLAAVSVTLALGVGAILVLRWRNGGRTSHDTRLPPGSRGLPFLGETLHYLAASSTLGLLPPFFQKRLERYIYTFFYISQQLPFQSIYQVAFMVPYRIGCSTGLEHRPVRCECDERRRCTHRQQGPCMLTAHWRHRFLRTHMHILFSRANSMLYFIFLYSSTIPKYVQYQIKYTTILKTHGVLYIL